MDFNIQALPALDRYIIARWAYSLGMPFMKDYEYDALDKMMKTIVPNNPYCTRSWSSDPCPIELLKKYNLQHLIEMVVISDRTESIESLNDWHSVKARLACVSPGTLSFKHDGWNVQASYYNGHIVTVRTRGRSTDSMDADQLKALLPETINHKGKLKVICECTLSNESFQIVKVKYNNTSQRASVSTILRAHPEDITLLSLHAFDVHGDTEDMQGNKFEYLKSLGFETPGYVTFTDFDSMVKGVRTLSDKQPSYQYPTDGVVVDYGNKYALRVEAWEQPICHSFVTGYEHSYNKFNITPKLEIYPVKRHGATQRKLAITNWSRIITLDLKPGSPVAFTIVSSAIADIDEETTKVLQQTYSGRYEEFQEMIKDNERMKEDGMFN